MKKILFISQKGGTGKTTLATEMAHSLARTEQSTPYAYYDLDTQGGAVYETMDNPNAVAAVIDTPGYLTDDAPEMIRDADVIILPTRASVLDMPPLERMRSLVESHAPNTPVIVVVNAWNRYSNAASFTDWLRESQKANETIVILPQSEAIPQSTALEKSVTDYAPKTRVAESVRKLTNIVREKIGLDEESAITYTPRIQVPGDDNNGKNQLR